ncbi:hypothetical protein [Fusibacter bizertensis]
MEKNNNNNAKKGPEIRGGNEKPAPTGPKPAVRPPSQTKQTQ